MKTVLITGAFGFIGPYLRSELEKLHHTVLTPQRNEFDITNFSSVQEFITTREPEVIFNLAAQSKPGLSFTAFDETFGINLFGTRHLLEAIRGIEGYAPRIFLFGSAEEHGPLAKELLPITEDSPFHPLNPYGLSKLAAYYLSLQYVHNYRMDIMHICPFTTLGPGQKIGFLVPDVCEQIVAIERGQQPPVLRVGNLSVQKDFTDVRDMVKGYVSLLSKGVSGERYNLCSGNAVATQKIVDMLIGLASVPIQIETDSKKFRPNETPVSYGSFHKIYGLTGWKPTITLESTLKDCLDFARKAGGGV